MLRDAQMNEYCGIFHQNFHFHQMLALLVLCNLDVDSSNIRNVKWRRPLVIQSWKAETELLIATLSKVSQGMQGSSTESSQLGRARLTNVNVFAELVLDNEARCNRDNVRQVVLH